MPLLDPPLTDMGNGERFAHLYRGRLLHVHGRGWLYWTGTHWQPDESGRATTAAKETTRRLLAAARAEIDRTGRTPTSPTSGRPTAPLSPAELAEKWATASQSLNRLFALRDLAASEPGMHATGVDLDRNAYALNAADGTIDLRTGELRPHNPEDRLTRCAPASLLDRRGPSLRWETFLAEILPDWQLRDYVQRAVGCSIIGRQDDHVIFLAYGAGGNGKGTFFRALTAALGPYTGTLPPEAVVETASNQHPTLFADLQGKRLVITAELPRNRKLDEGRVKSLTGGDNIKARFIGEDYFEFAPSHTVWLAANDKPRITGTDTGIWRRMRLLPFTAAIPAESRDPTLDAQLAECRNAILRWAVEGAVAYCRDGLGTCAAVEAATTAYRTEEDVFGQALDDLTVPTAGEGVPKTELRALLTAWYESGGYTWQPNDRQIKQEMDRRGIAEGTITTSTSKTRCWRGIARKANLPAEWQPRAPGKSWHDRD